jgi:hypothetical protein
LPNFGRPYIVGSTVRGNRPRPRAPIEHIAEPARSGPGQAPTGCGTTPATRGWLCAPIGCYPHCAPTGDRHARRQPRRGGHCHLPRPPISRAAGLVAVRETLKERAPSEWSRICGIVAEGSQVRRMVNRPAMATRCTSQTSMLESEARELRLGRRESTRRHLVDGRVVRVEPLGQQVRPRDLPTRRR